MTTEERKRTGYELIYLTACALHGAAPDEELTAGMNLPLLCRFAGAHALDAIFCMAVEGTAAYERAEPALQKKMQDAKNKAIRKNMLLDAERKSLFAWMDAEAIWHMPLKGVLLKELYPKAGMRQMSDNDILFAAAAQYRVRDHMKACGYTAVSVGKGNHDVYKKPPVYNFEMHTALFGSMHDPLWQDYYADVKERLLPDSEASFGFHFREEDFYLYFMAHACKHYKTGGTGLRTLTDTYVYIRSKGGTLDRTYIATEAEKLGISDFEEAVRKLAEKLFRAPVFPSESALSEEERGMLSYFLYSGTYGTTENHVKNRLDKLQEDGAPITKKTKRKYLWRRLFPDMEWYKSYAPFCYRHRWAIPFFWVWRLVRGVFTKRKNIAGELEAVKKV